jgi:hypothetical protein
MVGDVDAGGLDLAVQVGLDGADDGRVAVEDLDDFFEGWAAIKLKSVTVLVWG